MKKDRNLKILNPRLNSFFVYVVVFIKNPSSNLD